MWIKVAETCLEWCILIIKWDRVGQNRMFIGEYTHTVDDKRRVSVPSSFRDGLGENPVLTRGLDSCIFLFSEPEWEEIAAKVAALPFGDADARGLNRFLLSGAREVAIDRSGRILLPENLCEFADLEKEVVFVGVHGRIELWNPDRWSEYTNEVETQADLLAQTLGDVGMI